MFVFQSYACTLLEIVALSFCCHLPVHQSFGKSNLTIVHWLVRFHLLLVAYCEPLPMNLCHIFSSLKLMGSTATPSPPGVCHCCKMSKNISIFVNIAYQKYTLFPQALGLDWVLAGVEFSSGMGGWSSLVHDTNHLQKHSVLQARVISKNFDKGVSRYNVIKWV